MAETGLVSYLGSAQFIQAASNSSRLVAKLKSAIQNGELYETHQILRTIYFRFVNSKEKVFALKDLLYEGSCYLLKMGEFVSGQDIATIFLEAAAKCLQHRQEDSGNDVNDTTSSSLNYHQTRNTVDFDISHRVATVASQLPDSEIGRQKFVAETLKILTPKILNRELLHNVLAIELWKTKDFAGSRYHFLHCASVENADDIADLLIEYQMASASRNEIDLFIAQFTLQFLCLQCPMDSPKISNQKSNPVVPVTSRKTRKTIRQIAERVFLAYTSKHPSKSSLRQATSPLIFSLPLLNFTYFIISILDSDKDSNTFKMLCDIYQTTWVRDPSYKGYLDRIGAIYAGVIDEASKQRQGGLFNNILMSLLEEPDDEEDEANHEASNTFSSCDELD